MSERKRGPIIRVANPDLQVRLERQVEILQTRAAPVFVRFTSDVMPQEVRATNAGIMDALDASGQNRQVVAIPEDGGPQTSYGADDILGAAYRRNPRQGRFGRQVDINEINHFLFFEPKQADTPHLDV